MSCIKNAPLFNFACLVAERWLDRVPGVEGVGTYNLLYKYYDQKYQGSKQQYIV